MSQFLCLVTLWKFFWKEVTAGVRVPDDGLFDERIQFDFGVIFSDRAGDSLNFTAFLSSVFPSFSPLLFRGPLCN